MIKLIGALFIVFAGTMFGFFQAQQLIQRPKQIRQLIQALQRLETEIMYGHSPLPAALRSISTSLSEPLAALFGTAAEGLHAGRTDSAEESWRRAVSSMWGRTAMRNAERDIFLQLGTTLGRSDREDQGKHLRLAVHGLQSEEAAAAEEEKRYGSMWRSLGLLSGVLIVILMY